MSNFHITGCLMHGPLCIWTPGDGIVQEVPLFGLRTLPGSFLSCRELKDAIGYEKLMLSTYAEKAKPIVISVSMAPVSDHRTPH